MNRYLLALACGDSYGSCYEYEGLCGIKFNIKKLPNVAKEICCQVQTKNAPICSAKVHHLVTPIC